MNTEQAIEVIECEKGCAEADLANNEGHINTERFIDACNMALAALRNQQEREKGCAYCNSRFGIATHHTTESGLQVGTKRGAKCCPECGRKLGCD